MSTEHARQREFGWMEALSILLAMIGVQLSSEIFAMWGMLFYSPPGGTGRTIYVAVGLVWIIFVAGRVFDAITDPLIGSWSDNTATKASWWRLVRIDGRRRPFIFWGAIAMTFTAIAFWFPPVRGESIANLLYATVVVCLHWLFFTICVVPLNSLAPEIARSRQGRVRLGQWVAVGMILGLAIANIVPPILIVKLDPERQRQVEALHAARAAAATAASPSEAETSDAEEVHETFSSKGYQRTAAVFAGVSLVLFLLPVVFVRERYKSDPRRPKTPPFKEMLEALKNKVFLRYLAAFFLFMVG
ncbi:MAG: MFS transporter, partial [Candidatus Hydrogenedentes bacterium]|nr:MFS transporter [Candidatus Hydrogenedentota bacterium]